MVSPVDDLIPNHRSSFSAASVSAVSELQLCLTSFGVSRAIRSRQVNKDSGEMIGMLTSGGSFLINHEAHIIAAGILASIVYHIASERVFNIVCTYNTSDLSC